MSNYTFQNAQQALIMIKGNARTDPYAIQVIEFLIERVQALETANAPRTNCRKCGSILQKQTDGDLGCQRCDVEEILSQYGQEHDDALSRIVTELEHESLAKTMSSEDSQAKVAMSKTLFGDKFELTPSPQADQVIVASSPVPPNGAWTYLTGMPSLGDNITNETLLWGRYKKDAVVMPRRTAEWLLPALHRLYGRAPGSFHIEAPHSEQTKERIALYEKVTKPKPTNIETIHGEAYIDITINGSRRKAVVASHLTYESIIVSYDPCMASIEPKDWPGFRVEFSRPDSGMAGVVEVGHGVQVSPGMAITVNRAPAIPVMEVASTGTIAHGIATDFKFNLDRDDYRVHEALMTGMEIKRLLKNDAKINYALYIEEPNTGPDYAVGDDERVVVTGRIMYTVPPATFGSEPCLRCGEAKEDHAEVNETCPVGGPQASVFQPTGQEEAKQQVESLLGTAVEINVNSDKETLYFKDGEPREITYEQIIRIACDQIDKSKGRQVKPPGYDQFPQMSVTYRHRVPFEELPSERDGSLWKGKKVAVTPGMIINAYCT